MAAELAWPVEVYEIRQGRVALTTQNESREHDQYVEFAAFRSLLAAAQALYRSLDLSPCACCRAWQKAEDGSLSQVVTRLCQRCRNLASVAEMPAHG